MCASKILKPYGSKIAAKPEIKWVRIGVVEGADTIVVDCPVGDPVTPPSGTFVPAEVFQSTMFVTSLLNESVQLGPRTLDVPKKAFFLGTLTIDWTKLTTPWRPLFADADNDGTGEASVSMYPGDDPTPFNDDLPALQGGTWYLVDQNDCQPEVEIKVTVPPSGVVQVTQPRGGATSYTNSENAAVDKTFVLGPDAFNGEPPNTRKNALFAGSVRVLQTADSPTQAVTGNLFPFNCDDGRCDAVHHWVMDNGRPKAVYGDADGDSDPDHYSVTLDFPTVNAGQVNALNVPDVVSVPPPEAQVVINDVLFPYDGTSCTVENGCRSKTTTVAKSGGLPDDGDIVLGWQRSGTQVSVAYDKTEANATKHDAMGEGYRDPVLDENGMLIRGCIRVDPGDPAYNPEGYTVFDGFTSAPGGASGAPPAYKPYSDHVGLGEAYAGLVARSSSYTLDDIPAPGDNWLDYDNAWKFVCWRGSGNAMEFHPGKGMTYAFWPWGWFGSVPEQVRLSYVDGSARDDVRLQADIAGSVTPRFRLALNPLAQPKRLVPVRYRADTKPVTVTALAAYGGADDGWESVPLVSAGGVRLEADEEKVVAFWDVALKAGTWYLRASLEDDAGAASRRTVALRVGTEVPSSKNGPCFVTSPYRRAVLEFSQNSPFAGLVAISPVDPRQVGRGNVPKGFVVDISPSEMLFEQEPPRLSFFLTRDDIMAVNNGSLDNLGDLGLYYLDPDHHFIRAPFAAQRYRIDPDDGTWHDPVEVSGDYTVGENEGVEYHARIAHTSLYGVMSPNTYIEIDRPATPVSTLAMTLTGSVPVAHRDEVYLYVHNKPEWDASAQAYNRGGLEVADPAPGEPDRCAWRAVGVPLPFEGANYVFACIGPAAAGSNEPTNHVLVTRDYSAPVVENVSVRPGYAGEHAAAVVSVKVSEPAAVTVAAPGLLAGDARGGADADNNLVAQVGFALRRPNGEPAREGTYTIFASAADAVGNRTATPGMTSIIVDHTSPALSDIVLAARVNDAGEGQVRLSGRAADNVALARVDARVEREGSAAGEWSEQMNGETERGFDGFFPVFASSGWSPGMEVTASLTVIDRAGNRGAAGCVATVLAAEDTADWAHRSELYVSTAEGGAETYSALSSYPLLIRLDKGNFVFSEALPDGADMRFYDRDGRELAYEIERWDSRAGKAELWVSAPALAPQQQGQILVMRWGNPAAQPPAYGPFVWDGAYRAVYHLADRTGRREEVQP